MAIKSITQRWILNTLSVIVLLIIFIGTAFSFALQNFYYNGVRQWINSQTTVISNYLDQIAQNENMNFNEELQNTVTNSVEKNRMEISLINHSGEVVRSSSGFAFNVQETMPDFEEARANYSATGSDTGDYIGKNTAGESIMAVTKLLPYINTEYAAVRYVVSMEEINRVLFVYIIAIILAGLAIIGLVLLSGLYFIKSIVRPVREVSAVARKFAAGDLRTRIIKKSDDELGELCDVINFMADEISASEEVKNEFISSVSHELRTPLTAIKGWSETLMTSDENDTQTLSKGMRVITNETERLSSMVEELLDFSRMQDGRFTLIKTTMDVLIELGDAVLIYTERAKRENIRLIYEEPEQVSLIFADKNRLRQVFINIIDNALKYSDAGDSVTVSVKEENNQIVIAVSDTGCGIPPEDLPKVKAKFFKGNQTRRGSGIGLAIADEIVHLHDGSIEIESVLNEGTAVSICLPVNLKKGETRKTEISTTMEFTLGEEGNEYERK